MEFDIDIFTLSLAGEVNPKKVFPVHTEHPEVFKKYLGKRVKLPRKGQKIKFK